MFAKDENIAIAYGMGITAEKVAEEWKVSREDQDAFAYASHQKAMAAIAAGEFRDEILPYQVISRHARTWPATRIKLRRSAWSTPTKARARTPPGRPGQAAPGVQRSGGSVTAGNCSQMSDGAGAVLLAQRAAIKEYGLTPLARFVSFSVAGVRPEVMGIGPIAAIPKALKQAGLTQDQIDWIELNEAFAAQALAVIRDLRPGPDQGQPAGRRDRPGPSAGRHRRDPHRHHRARHAPPQAEVRHGHDVHRHRHGRGGHLRMPLTFPRCGTTGSGRGPFLLAMARITWEGLESRCFADEKHRD